MGCNLIVRYDFRGQISKCSRYFHQKFLCLTFGLHRICSYCKDVQKATPVIMWVVRWNTNAGNPIPTSDIRIFHASSFSNATSVTKEFNFEALFLLLYLLLTYSLNIKHSSHSLDTFHINVFVS